MDGMRTGEEGIQGGMLVPSVNEASIETFDVCGGVRRVGAKGVDPVAIAQD